MWKEYLDRERERHLDIKCIYVHIYSVILIVLYSAPYLLQYTASMKQIFT